MQRHIFSILLFLILAINSSYGQSSISGTITDGDNVSVIGAVVTLSNDIQKENTVTDLNGNFQFDNLDQTYNKLMVRSLGYKNYEQKLNAANFETPLTITLETDNIQLQSVEVIGRARTDYNSDYSFSATKVAILNKELPQSISSVTKEFISDRQAFQLSDAVKAVSSVSSTGLYNHFNIRGITQAEDGQSINGLRTRQYYFLQPITSHIERVEVIKGPSSVTFSSADPGGTINMVTKKPLKEKRGEVSLTAGSFSTLRAAVDLTGPLNKNKTLLYRLNAAFQEAKSFRDLVNNNAFLITPSLSFVPNESTALNVEMIYNKSVGNLDRGQPIFGAINGEFDINSTPISLNVGAANDHYKTDELIFTTSFNKKFTEKLGFNAQYMKQTWSEDLAEHRVDGAAVDIEGNVIPTLARLRYDQRQ